MELIAVSGARQPRLLSQIALITDVAPTQDSRVELYTVLPVSANFKGFFLALINTLHPCFVPSPSILPAFMSVSLPLDILRLFQVRLRASPGDGRLGFDISPHSLPSNGILSTMHGGPIVLSFTPFEDDKGHGLCVEATSADQAQSSTSHPSRPSSAGNDHCSCSPVIRRTWR